MIQAASSGTPLELASRRRRGIQVVSSGASGPTTAYRTAVLADSPVSYWHFAEPSGTTAADVQGVNGGTYVNTPTLGVTALNSDTGDLAASFASASSQRVNVPAAASLNLADVFTLEAIVKPTAIGVSLGIMSKGTNAYYIRINASGALELVQSQTAVLVASTSTLTAGTAFHVAATKNAATVKLYINGADVTGVVTNATMVNSAFALTIGGDTASGTPAEFFNGVIDEPALYATALSAARVAAHSAAR